MNNRTGQPKNILPAPFYAMRGRRRGGSAAVFVCPAVVIAAVIAAILTICTFAGYFTNRPGSDAAAVYSATKLNSVSCSDPVYYSENDSVTDSADNAAYTYYSGVRASYGLSTCSRSSALSRLASYAAIAAVSYEPPVSGSAAKARSASAGSVISSATGNVSGCDGFIFKYFTTYSLTDSGRAAEAAISSMINTDSTAKILLSSVKTCGIASALRITDEGTECCFVIFYSGSSFSDSQEQAVNAGLPDVLSISGDIPSLSADSAAGSLTVKKGASITENMLKDACGMVNFRGEPYGISFNSGDASTSAAGQKNVNITLSSGGRSVGSFVELTVSENVSPVLPDGPQTVYKVPEGEILNLIPQMNFSAAGAPGALTSPLVISYEDTETVSQTRLFIKDAAGSVHTCPVQLEYGSATYAMASLSYTDNKGLYIRTPGGAALHAGGQAVVRFETATAMIKPGSGAGSSSSGARKIRFTFTDPAGKSAVVIKDDTLIVWNPLSEGPYQVKAEIIDLSGTVIYSANVKINVEKRVEVDYNNPVTGPTATATTVPTATATTVPTATATNVPTATATTVPTVTPTTAPTATATTVPTVTPTTVPTAVPTATATTVPTTAPTTKPSDDPVISFLSEKIRTEDASDGSVLIRGIPAETRADSIGELITVSGGSGAALTVLKVDGSPASGETLLATAAKLRIVNGGETFAEFTVIISGDVNGDGKVGIGDFAKLRQQLLKGNIITGAFVYAGDLNGDGALGIGDFAKLRQYLLGRIALD